MGWITYDIGNTTLEDKGDKGNENCVPCNYAYASTLVDKGAKEMIIGNYCVAGRN